MRKTEEYTYKLEKYKQEVREKIKESIDVVQEKGSEGKLQNI